MTSKTDFFFSKTMMCQPKHIDKNIKFVSFRRSIDPSPLYNCLMQNKNIYSLK